MIIRRPRQHGEIACLEQAARHLERAADALTRCSYNPPSIERVAEIAARVRKEAR